MGLETDPIVGSAVHIAITEVGEEIIIIIKMTEITDLTIGLIGLIVLYNAMSL